MNAPLVPVTVAFLSGILVGTFARLPAWSLVIVGAVSAGVSLWRWRYARAGVVALLLLWACLGTLRMAVWERHPDIHLAEALSDDPQPVRLHGLVVDDPVELFEPGDAHAGTEGEASVDPDRQVCVLELRHRWTAQGWQPIHGRLRATIHSPRELLRYGDEVLVEGEWSRVPAPGNPGQYDLRAALARHRIHGLLRVKPFHGLARLRRHQGHPVIGWICRLRHRWERLIDGAFAPREADLLRSLLLGQRRRLDEDLQDAFVETGTVHLLVISGFNVGIIAWLLELGLRLTGVPWRLRLFLSALGLGGYCLLTGMQPPVARATLMAWVVLGAYALDRVISWPNTLAAAALAILWIEPMQLFDPGFQLSFGAVLSLMVFVPRWSGWLERGASRVRPVWLRRYLAASLAATTAVWVGLAPVLAWYFHLCSPVSVLANLLIAPLMSALIMLGTTLVTAGTLLPAAMGWGSGPLTWLLQATILCVSWCHAVPFGHRYVGYAPAPVLGGYYVLVGVSLLRHRLGLRRGRLVLCWLAGLAVWAATTAVIQWRESRWLRVEVLDVGHGDSILVRLPRGPTMLVDAGSRDAGRLRVVPLLRFRGIASLDALLLTHWDEDHLGGAVPVLRSLRVRRVLTNGAYDDTMSARHLTRLLADQRIPTVALARGMTVDAGPLTRAEVLHPPPGLVPGSEPASNDNCVVLKVTNGAISVLLTGDIEEAGLPWLLRDPQAPRASVLKIPHHGSRLGEAGERLLDAVRPQMAIISVGRLHHLPAAETLEALRRRGIAVYSTVRDGAITVRTDGKRLEVRTFKGESVWRTVTR